MTISVPGSLSTPASTATPASAPSGTTQQEPKTSAPTDTVRLSQAAQVHLLKQQGQLLSQIAVSLSIPIATVDSYLGVQAPKPAVTQSSAPSPDHTQAPQTQAPQTQAPQTQGPVVASEPSAKG
jgi:hypothetical protein